MESGPDKHSADKGSTNRRPSVPDREVERPIPRVERGAQRSSRYESRPHLHCGPRGPRGRHHESEEGLLDELFVDQQTNTRLSGCGRELVC